MRTVSLQYLLQKNSTNIKSQEWAEGLLKISSNVAATPKKWQQDIVPNFRHLQYISCFR